MENIVQAYEKLLQMYRNNPDVTQEDIKKEIPQWLFLQEFSERRTNIVRWIDLSSEDTVLEVGAGCGAVTGYLSQHAGHVVCIERRGVMAQILKCRYAKERQIEILDDGMEHLVESMKFDKIFVWDMDAVSPQDLIEQLQTLADRLTEQGAMYVGLQNRFALRRWAGYQDETMSIEFANSAMYVSRNELDHMLEAFRSRGIMLYYPYPDSRYMLSLYSDQHLPVQGELTENAVPSPKKYLSRLDEKLLFDELIEAGEYTQYANSYLLVVGGRTPVLYAKMSNDRAKTFNIQTQIVLAEDGTKEVHKMPDGEDAREHVFSLGEVSARLDKVFSDSLLFPNRCKVTDRDVIFEYVEGKSLETLINQHIVQNQTGEALRLLDQYIELLREVYGGQSMCNSSDFQSIFGNVALPSGIEGSPWLNIDAILPNIYVDQEHWTMIDCEWTFDFPIPVDFLIYRILFYFGQNNPEKLEKIGIDLWKRYQISELDRMNYQRMEENFQSYTKDHGLTYQDTIRQFRKKQTILENISDGAGYQLYDKIHEVRVDALEEKLLNLVTLARDDSFYFYAAQGKIRKKGKGDILLISHELSRTGAPIVLQDMAMVLCCQGYRVTLVSVKDGPLRMELNRAGIPVIIDRTIFDLSANKLGFSQNLINCSLITVTNTVETCKVVTSNLHTDNRIIWWLHEALEGFQVKTTILPQYLSDNVYVYFVADSVYNNMKKAGLCYEGRILHYGVRSMERTCHRKGGDTVRFICVGSYCRRKGQDLLADAISRLPLEILQQCEFYFAGPVAEVGLANAIKNMSEVFPNVYYYEEMPREQIQQLYQQMDCLVIPSRDDPLPVVATENMSLSNICICSSNTGTADLIRDGENGFVFQNEDVHELMAKIIYVVRHKSQLALLGQKSRRIFDQNFEMHVFENNIASIVHFVMEGMV